MTDVKIIQQSSAQALDQKVEIVEDSANNRKIEVKEIKDFQQLEESSTDSQALDQENYLPPPPLKLSYAETLKSVREVATQPVKPVATIGKSENSFLIEPSVPNFLKRILENGLKSWPGMTDKESEILQKILRLKDEGIGPSNYESYLKFLIYADAYQAEVKIGDFDMFSVPITPFVDDMNRQLFLVNMNSMERIHLVNHLCKIKETTLTSLYVYVLVHATNIAWAALWDVHLNYGPLYLYNLGPYLILQDIDKD